MAHVGLWGSNAAASNNAPIFTVESQVNKANATVNNVTLFSNTVPVGNMVVGLYGVSPLMANVANTAGKKNIVPGWYVVRWGEGGVNSIAVVGNSTPTQYANGQSLVFTGGTVTGKALLQTNATGNVVGASIANAGLFSNVSVMTTAFTNEEYLTTITATAGKYATNIIVTGGTLAYNNTDYIILSNGVVNSAKITLVTNATGFLTNGNFTFGAGLANGGLFLAATTNAQVVATVYAANGSPSNGTGAALVANLATATISAYSNTDYILVTNSAAIVNGQASILTNTLGGFVTANITLTNLGVFPNTTTNAQLVVTARAANGALSNGFGATFTGNLVQSVTSALKSVTVTLGGRAGKRWNECFVVIPSMTANSTINTAAFPNHS